MTGTRRPRVPVPIEGPQPSGWRGLAKASFDRTGAALTLLLLVPVLLGLAVAVKASGPGPVLVGQLRVGRGGRMFRLLRFRTVDVGAVSTPDGPTVGRVGEWLRRYSLDELPQLFNVLRGDMSLVGPRPPLPEEVERYDADMRRRFVVKPGLMGLWQVSGRSDLSWEDSVRIDLQYVERWSLFLDLMIIWRTLGAVVRREAAY